MLTRTRKGVPALATFVAALATLGGAGYYAVATITLAQRGVAVQATTATIGAIAVTVAAFAVAIIAALVWEVRVA